VFALLAFAAERRAAAPLLLSGGRAAIDRCLPRSEQAAARCGGGVMGPGM